MAVENTPKCKGCGGPLTNLKWNSTTSVLVCDNITCVRFRNPVIPDDTNNTVTAKERSKLKLRGYTFHEGDNGKIDDITVRLQRMRRNLYSEN